MKFCRYDDNRLGVVRDDGVHDVSGALEKLPALHYPFPVEDQLINNLDQLRPEMEKLADGAPALDPAGLKFLSPVANPSKVIGTPTNYMAHREEASIDPDFGGGSTSRYVGKSIEEQGLFLKANSALVGPGEGVAVRFPDRRTDHEAELGVIIGKAGSDIPESEAFNHVAGYALALDMVVRGTEDRSFRKSIDTYAVLGPWVVTADEIDDPDNLDFALTVSGEPRQKSNTSLMIMNIARQISWGSTFYTLLPGDIIMTGTCEGVGRVGPGDVIEMEMQDIGRMEVPVRAHQ